MSGGLAYVLDENHDLYKRLNHELVKMYALNDETSTLSKADSKSDSESPDEKLLRSLIEEHAAETGSQRAKEILSDWDNWKFKFKKIIPNDYLRIMSEIKVQEAGGASHDEAILAAFKKCTA
jgi:glutamate synthase (ferredoxin)